MGKPGHADKETALIAAARREVASRPAATAVPAPLTVQPSAHLSAPAPTPVPPAAVPDVAARVAVLLGAEEEARQRRRKKLRQIGIAVPALALAAAFLWLASVLLRYFRF